MPLPLTKSLLREVSIDGVPHTVAIGPDGVKVTPKGFRKGHVLSWRDVLALGADEGPSARSTQQSQRNTPSDRQ